jgi:5-dehydro-2-deoxygluconokinase
VRKAIDDGAHRRGRAGGDHDSTSSPSAAPPSISTASRSARLEDVASFAKSVGGCPTNIAIGTARLGLRSASSPASATSRWAASSASRCPRGRRDDRHQVTDKERLTALVLLGGRGRQAFAADLRIATDCADMALSEADIDPAFIARPAPSSSPARISRGPTPRPPAQGDPHRQGAGGKVVFDIDYRPNLWGLAGHAARVNPATSRPTCRHHASAAADCDLIVGTEEEIMIASGARTRSPR